MTISSFRDPAGSVIIKENNVTRLVANEYLHIVDFAKEVHSQEPSWLIETTSATVEDLEGYVKNDVDHESVALMVHPKVFFPSYPSEWSASQLWDAAIRTLNILEISLNQGFTLKDASAYNLLFEHTNPLFIDILSFEVLGEKSPFWLAYGQFCRHFIYPLTAYKETGINITEIFRTFHDGLTLSHLKKYLPSRSYIKPSLFKDLYLISFLGKIEKKFKKPVEQHLKGIDAKKLQVRLLHVLRKRLMRLKPKTRDSIWNNYVSQRAHYSQIALKEKQKAVEDFLDTYKPSSLLDLGCNSGEYAIIAAKRGINVVAVDNDASCIDSLYQEASTNNLPLLPLVMDLANPTPQMGFLHAERSSFQNRIKGSFQAILCLSLIHHFVLVERLPLALIFEFFKSTKASYVLLEWVGPGDEKVLEISSFSKDRLSQLERSFFEETARSYCTIEKRIDFTSLERSLYVLNFSK